MRAVDVLMYVLLYVIQQLLCKVIVEIKLLVKNSNRLNLAVV